MNLRVGTILLLACLLPAASGRAGDSAPESRSPLAALSTKSVIRERSASVVSPRLEKTMALVPTGSVKIWVFFTDKNIAARGGFDRAAAAVTLTERALKRRTKVGLDQVVFADLGVAPNYIRAIEELGGAHRRSSRWLNAASFDIPAASIQRVSQLPFVAELRLVASYRRPPEPVDETRSPIPEQALSAEYDLDYGESVYQLEQINVPAAHDAGLSGAGVTLAIIDTGHRQTHEAFAAHFAAGRVLAQYDFVYNDSNTDYDEGDWGTENSHGTKVWSIAAGEAHGELYGPAYRSNIILCKTEDMRSETNAEEDNWVAALEFADSIGTDVIATSLGYMIFDDTCNCDYTYEDMDGQTATISFAASMCDGLGIIVCNSAGNSGPSAGTMTPPADAFGILAVGSVDGGGTVAGSSSRGPTYDGRIKPEVCARGVRTRAAHPSYDNVYGDFYGTSFAAPLVAGAACLVIEAHPEWRPYQVREALKMSGHNAATPDNNYGWGIIDVMAAIGMEPGCCSGKVGDINGRGGDEPTLGDIATLIDHLFISFAPIDCLTEADLNQSGGADPTEDDISIGDISILIDHLFITGLDLADCM